MDAEGTIDPLNGKPPEKWAVVINRSAGGNGSVGETQLESLGDLFRERGLQVDFHVVPGTEIESTIRTALKEGADGIVAGGGDGTISTVVGVLAHGEVPLGILPLGTLNHFAKDLGIPLSLPEAVGVIAEGHVSRIDLAEVNGHIFINNSSIGAYPLVILIREHQRRHLGRPKWIAVGFAFFHFLQRFKVMTVRMELDGIGISRRTPFVFVGNNEYELDKTLTAARRSLTGACLCVYTARCDHWVQFLRLFGLLLTNRLADAPEFEAHCVSEVRVRTGKSPLLVSRDGEIFHMHMPLHYRTLTQALLVMVPKAP